MAKSLATFPFTIRASPSTPRIHDLSEQESARVLASKLLAVLNNWKHLPSTGVLIYDALTACSLCTHKRLSVGLYYPSGWNVAIHTLYPLPSVDTT